LSGVDDKRVLVSALRGDNPLLRRVRVVNEDDIPIHILNVTITLYQQVGAVWWSIYSCGVELLITRDYIHKVDSESHDLLLVPHR